MFGISFTELIVIFTICLVIFGPDKLPELAAKLGRLSAELRKHTDAVRREFYNTVYKPADTIGGEINRELSGLKTDIIAENNVLNDIKNECCENDYPCGGEGFEDQQQDESDKEKEPGTPT